MIKTVKFGKKAMVFNARKLIRSAAEDEDENLEEETVDEESALEESTDDVAPEGETDGFDMDEDIVDEINENDDFGGEELAKEDIIDAIKVIDEIATAVTEKEGEGANMDADTVLNKVEEFTDDSVGGDDMDAELDFGEEIPDELANSVVRVMVQDANSDVTVENEQPAIDVQPEAEIYTDVVEETPATVYDSDMNAADVELDGEDDSDAEDDDLLVVGNSKSTTFKKGVIKLNSSLARKNPMNWKKAYSKVTSALKNTKKVLSASDWALIQMLAQAYNRELSNKMINVKRVVSAMKKSEKLRKMIQSEIDFENSTQATAAKPFDENGAPESETKPETTVGEVEMKIDENVGDNQAGEVDSTSGDPVVSTSTEEDKEGEIANDPAGTIEMLTLPISNSVQTIVLRKVGKNTFIGCGFIPSKEKGIKLVKANREVLGKAKANQALVNALDGKVVTFKDGTAMILKSSNLYGLMACHCAFTKGINGAKYEVFKKIGSSFVSPNGVAISSSCKAEYMIASSASNKSAKKTDKTFEDVFCALEKELHRREIIKNSLRVKSDARHNQGKEIQSNAQKYQKKINILSSMLRKRDAEIKRLTKLASGTEATVRAQIAERDRENLFANSQKQVAQESAAIKSSAEKNIDYMARMMSKMF